MKSERMKSENYFIFRAKAVSNQQRTIHKFSSIAKRPFSISDTAYYSQRYGLSLGAKQYVCGDEAAIMIEANQYPSSFTMVEIRSIVVRRVGTRGRRRTFSIMPISCNMAFTPAGLPSTKSSLNSSVNL